MAIASPIKSFIALLHVTTNFQQDALSNIVENYLYRYLVLEYLKMYLIAGRQTEGIGVIILPRSQFEEEIY